MTGWNNSFHEKISSAATVADWYKIFLKLMFKVSDLCLNKRTISSMLFFSSLFQREQIQIFGLTAYLPTLGNQKSGHFHHCSNPPPPLPLQTKCFSYTKWKEDWSRSIVHYTPHWNLWAVFIRMVRIDKGISSKFAEKRPGKILIYDLDITLKTGIFFAAEILENRDVQIFGSFESQKSELSR